MTKTYTQADLTPSVKLLEWVEFSRGAIATSQVGEYRVHPTANKSNNNHRVIALIDRNIHVIGFYDGLEVAKAAAQADYEKRILSALNFTPSDKDAEIERLREALKEAGDYLEAYKVNTQIDLGDASDMPFVDDTLKKIDAALEERG